MKYLICALMLVMSVDSSFADKKMINSNNPMVCTTSATPLVKLYKFKCKHCGIKMKVKNLKQKCKVCGCKYNAKDCMK